MKVLSTGPAHLVGVAMLAALLVTNVCGQSSAGTVVGAVTDAAGAVVPGATVTIANPASGATRTVVANDSGQYRVDAFPVGAFTITATKPGFEKLIRSGSELTVAEVLTVNIELKVGNVQETVEVTTAAPQVETQTADISTLISNVQVVETPLNGRDFVNLNLLSAGACCAPATTSPVGFGSRAGAGVDYNGSTGNNNAYYVDGIYDMQLWNYNIVIVPTIDSIEEQRLLTNSYSSQYGGGAGAVTVVQSKSGGDKYHGDVYEFVKNGLLDANLKFAELANPVIPKQIEKRNEFGGTFGGPIRRNKTFFFADFQEIRWVQPSLATQSVPTNAITNELATGVFGATPIYDPLTCNSTGKSCTAFPKNAAGNYYIPNYATRVSQPALNLMSIVPTPLNGNTSNNYSWNPVSVQDDFQGDGRIDQNIGTKGDRLFAKFSADWSAPYGACTLPPNSTYAAQFNINPKCLNTANPYSDVQQNWSITANYIKIISPTFIDETRIGGVHNVVALTAASNYLDNADPLGIPGFYLGPNNAGLPGVSVSGITNFVTGGGYDPEYMHITFFQYENVATWNKGAHSIKFGAQVLRDRFNGHDTPASAGTFTFNGIFTNNGTASSNTALADFALGYPEAITRSEQFGEFGLRDWKFNPFVEDSWRVSKRLTATYGIRWEVRTPWDQLGGQNNIFTNMNAQGQVLFPNNNPCGLSTICLDKTAFAPRAGVTYLLTGDGKTVFRMGGGVANFWATNGGELLDQNPPMNINQSFTQTGVNASTIYTLSSGIPAVAEPNLLNPAALTPIWYAEDPHTKQAQNLQWNANIERQLRSDMVLTVGYVGAKTNFMMNPIDPNQAALQQPGGTLTLAQRRPLYNLNPAIQDINYRANAFGAKYESLQVNLDKRYAYGLTGHVAFTWSHNEDSTAGASGSIAPIENSYCVKCEWGNATDNHERMLVISHVYELPFGKGRQFVKSGVASYVVGGWGITGLWTMYSGGWFTATNSTSNVSGIAYSGTGSAAERAQLVPNCNINAPAGGRTLAQWFNTSCFTQAASNTFGNSKNGSIVGPAFYNLDAQLNRSFPIRENMRLQVRWEAFNALNKVNYSTFSTGIGSATAPAGVMSAANPSRVMQLAAKLIF